MKDTTASPPASIDRELSEKSQEWVPLTAIGNALLRRAATAAVLQVQRLAEPGAAQRDGDGPFATGAQEAAQVGGAPWHGPAALDGETQRKRLETAKERRRTAAVDAMGKLEERKNARGKLRRNRKDRDDWDDDGRRTYGKLGGMGGIDRYGKNKGVDARTDKDKRGMRDQSNEGVMEALERKAAQYEKLSRGEYDEKDADKYDVDFHRKGAMGAGGDPMAALEEEARKRTMGPNIGFDYGGGGMPDWRGGVPPPPMPEYVRVREVPPPPMMMGMQPPAHMPPVMMPPPPPVMMPPPLVQVPPPPPR